MVKAKTFLYKTHFDGFPKKTDFELVEEELPSIKNGEFLAEALFLSVDPYMRAYAPNQPLGKTFLGSQLAKIIDSKNPKYPVGTYVVGQFGWRTHTISDGTSNSSLMDVWKVPKLDDLPLSLTLGVLGMPGNTAYFGFLELCKPQPGDTVVVSGAAGAVGSIVGQIAKIKGCNVIGIAGSDEKGKWLIDDLKFDKFINYKDPDFESKLKELTPKGVDCYFDNVGGEISTSVISRMNTFGRISVCGSISGYNDKNPQKIRPIQPFLVGKQLKMEGFLVTKWLDRWTEGIQENKKWIQEGKLKYQETMTEGFENMVKAFTDMLNGVNLGKAVIKV